MKIIILTCNTPIERAGVLVYDWYKSLKDYGHTLAIITQYYDKRLEVDMYSVYGRLESLIRKKIRNFEHRFIEKNMTDSSYCMHSLYETKKYIPTKKLINLFPFQPDVIIVLFPHRFLNARNIFELNNQTGSPICISPVDMAEFTGGCHYSNGCKGFEKNCGNCPGLFSKQEKDQTFKNIQYKKRYLSQTNLFTLTNTWTSTLIKKSSIFKGKPDFRINVVVNENHYLPGNKQEAKKHFLVPETKNIIFFGANYVQEKRKGFSYLIEAVNNLYEELDEKERQSIGIAIAGIDGFKIKDFFPFEVFVLGQLSHDELNKAFQMADVFVSPSIQDAGPMMVVQSLMCGTPVVAFKMGNSIEFIVDGFTGFQASLYNVNELKIGIYKLLNLSNDDKLKISKNCRKLAIEKSSYHVFSREISFLFDKFLNK